MQKSDGSINRPVNRRSFLKTGMLAGSAATVGAGLAGSLKPAFGQSNSLTKGDVAILRFSC
jgi:anaerobic selenocysteine-containing dehydrogenase